MRSVLQTIIFVTTALGIYSAMHLLVYWGIRPLLRRHRALPAMVISWMAPMILAPVIVRMLDKAGLGDLARQLAWVGFTWMGFLFIAFSLFLPLGLWELFARLQKKLKPSAPRLALHGAQTAGAIFLITLVAGRYKNCDRCRLKVNGTLPWQRIIAAWLG